MSFCPKHILVTGAAGFIGCNFVRMMLSRYSDIRIISLDKLTYAGSLENLSDVIHDERHTFIHGDIGDRALIAATLRHYHIDTVVNFAAESHVDNSIAYAEVFFQTNVMGTVALLDESKKYWLDEQGWGHSQCRFHHVSTDEVFGSLEKDEPAFTEYSSYAPNSPYAASKASSDHAVRCYHQTYGLPVTLSNCSNNFGPFQHTEKLIPVIVTACLSQQPIPIYGNGGNIRDWLYVGDHCHAIALILNKGEAGQTYNIGGNNELSNLAIARKVCHVVDKLQPHSQPCERLITFVSDRPGHDWRYAIDGQKAKDQLHFFVRAPFDQRLLETIQFYCESKCTTVT